MDLLPSSVIASIAGSPSAINLGGYEHDRRRLDFKDIVVGLAHPFSNELELPNHNQFRLHQFILGELDRTASRTADLATIATTHNLSPTPLNRPASGGPLDGDPVRYSEHLTSSVN